MIDWNLCFNARGESSNRSFRSGTPAFMAPVLLKDKPLPRRTLAHDMESFFAVILWIATLNYFSEAAFQATPLATTMLDKKKTPMDITNAKRMWFGNSKWFYESITVYFTQSVRADKGFRMCLFKLREILYPEESLDLDAFLSDDLGKKDKEAGDADPMKEDLFRQCMKEIDDYLGDGKGCSEMQWIDSNALGQHTLEGRGRRKAAKGTGRK